jgi:murein DD-endopeptidase MepM/ murein hydrolase activator NlpD
MRKRYVNYWKISLLVILGSFTTAAKAQDSIRKTSSHLDFDTDLVPAQSIYGKSWDNENVDSPAYNAERMSWGYLINLVEDGYEFVPPFQGRITSNYGWRHGRWHKGIDIALDIGDPVYAAFDGVVRMQRYNAGGYGNYVLIRHYNGLETIYAHLSEGLVVRNQEVKAGDVIGFGGSTGRSTGPHLHFETRLMGQAFDPARIIDFKSFQLKTEQAYVNQTWFPYIRSTITASVDDEPIKLEPKLAAEAPTKKYYKVKKGDTLYAISKKYGVPVNTICKLNKITRNTTLKIGRSIRVK